MKKKDRARLEESILDCKWGTGLYMFAGMVFLIWGILDPTWAFCFGGLACLYLSLMFYISVLRFELRLK